MKDDLSEDIPGSRVMIEDAATRLHIYFFFGMSMLGALLFLIGMCKTGPKQLDAIPDPVIWICVGMGGFSLFFPWFVFLLFARHFLHTVNLLERRLEWLEKSTRPPKNRSGWRDDDLGFVEEGLPEG